MKYKVSAKPRDGYGGFWRSGRFFPNYPEFVTLDESEMTDAIRSEPMLIVVEIKEEKKKHVPANADQPA